jgi:hypothetical protein
MSTLDDFIPEPRLCELHSIRVGADPETAFRAARHFDLASVPLASALFRLRALPERLHDRGEQQPLHLRLDEIGRAGAGFQVLEDRPDHLIVGAIGRFWEPEIPFHQVPTAAFAGFGEPGWGKIAWELRREDDAPGSRISFELRVTATDDGAWRKLRRYYRLIGPFSQLIRRQALSAMARELGTPEDMESVKPLPGDAIIARPKAQATHAITIEAPPGAVWPWLVQMGCLRAGWYSHDDLDNAGVLSATEIVPELQRIAVGDRLPARPDGSASFTVLALDPGRALVLGGLWDTELERELPIDAGKPAQFWQATWAFALEALPGERTRLIVRARADFAPDHLPARVGTRIYGLVHHFMQTEQLRNLKRRAEQRMPRVHDTWTDVAEGIAGAGLMLADLVTPFLRGVRSHWGMTRAEAGRVHEGDEYVPEPRWQWTHAVDIEAPPEAVWPWLVQIGQDRAGFYSYQFLENLAGTAVQNAARVHAQWQALRVGDDLRLHPGTAPLKIAAVEPGRFLIARAGVDPRTGAALSDAAAKAADTTAKSFVAVSWALLLEPHPDGTTRLVSRFRSTCSNDLATRILSGAYLTEAIGFAMDRRMLRGIKQRAERSATHVACKG